MASPFPLSWWLIGIVVSIVAILVAGLSVAVVRLVSRSLHLPVATGIEALVGAHGVATSELSPAGTISVNGESWRATAAHTSIANGAAVTVIGVEGVTLIVANTKERPCPPPSLPPRSSPWSPSFWS